MEILAQETVVVSEPNYLLMIIIPFGIVMLGIVIGVAVGNITYDDNWSAAIAIICIILALLLVPIIGVVTETPTGESYEVYKVTLDDTVNFNEFYNTYEILDQEGKIYTIREK